MCVVLCCVVSVSSRCDEAWGLGGASLRLAALEGWDTVPIYLSAYPFWPRSESKIRNH